MSSGHMYSSVHPGEVSSLFYSPEGLFTFFYPESFLSIFFGEFFLIRCEVKGQGCRMWTEFKALWGKFVVCDVWLYKIN